jgi:hypothetical protein
MAYTRSKARKQFELDVGDLLRTIREAYSGQCSSSAVRQFALCSAVVLCSARFEGYIEDLIAQFGSSVVGHGITTEKLPRTLRAFLLNQPSMAAAYRGFLIDNDEAVFLSRLEAVIGQAGSGSV